MKDARKDRIQAWANAHGWWFWAPNDQGGAQQAADGLPAKGALLLQHLGCQGDPVPSATGSSTTSTSGGGGDANQILFVTDYSIVPSLYSDHNAVVATFATKPAP